MLYNKNIIFLIILICVNNEVLARSARQIIDDPCQPYNPLMPNFSSPGRRLSTEKCLEYIWRVKQRIDKKNRERECEVSKCTSPCGGGGIGGRDTLDGEFPHMVILPSLPYVGLHINLSALQNQNLLPEALRIPVDLPNNGNGLNYAPAAVGGRKSQHGEFPHMLIVWLNIPEMAAIGWEATDRNVRWQFKCCGSLISENFVLTAGHCVRSVRDPQVADPIPKIVRVGNKNIANNKEHVDIDIVKIISHNNYRPPKRYYDIALMKIAEPIEFTYYIQPACILTDDILTNEFGTSVTATGWGITQLRGQPSEELQAVNLELFDSNFCDPLLSSACNRLWCGLQDHQICAANLSGGVDTCSGDSGGPLQVNIPFPDKYKYVAKIHGIVGITSFGIKCALPNTPGIYTRVSYFLDWIEDIVWRDEVGDRDY